MTSLNYSFFLNLHIYSLYSLYILYWYILFFKSEQNLKTTKSRSLLFWDYVWQKHHKIEKRLAFCTLDNYCLFYNINEVKNALYLQYFDAFSVHQKTTNDT